MREYFRASMCHVVSRRDCERISNLSEKRSIREQNVSGILTLIMCHLYSIEFVKSFS